jgi:hypothetical protein
MAKDILATEEIKNDLLLSTESKGFSVWQWAALRG